MKISEMAKALRYAAQVAEAMPDSGDSVEFHLGLDDDDYIALDWYSGSGNRTLSVCVPSNGRIGWASLIDGEPANGSFELHPKTGQFRTDDLRALADTVRLLG